MSIAKLVRRMVLTESRSSHGLQSVLIRPHIEGKYHSVIFFGAGNIHSPASHYSPEAQNLRAVEGDFFEGADSLKREYPTAICAGSDFSLEWRFGLDGDCFWSTVVEELQADTIFNFSRELANTFPASRLKFFYGADSRPRQVLKQADAKLLAHKGASCTATLTSTPRIDIRAVTSDRRVLCTSFKTRDLVQGSLRTEIDRHKINLRTGALIEYGRPVANEQEHTEIVRALLKLEDVVSGELRDFLGKQVQALENRIQKSDARQRLYLDGKFVGVVPKNEIETLILFLRYVSLSFNSLPGGATIELLDFSPKGIDAICKFAPNANTPALTVPVEFEFELGNFFLHGHDHEQVKVIVCFQAERAAVGWERFGIHYSLEREKGLPVLRNNRDRSFIHCVILSELISE